MSCPTGKNLVVFSALLALRLQNHLASASNAAGGVQTNLVRREPRSAAVGVLEDGGNNGNNADKLQVVLDPSGAALHESAADALQDVLSSSFLETASASSSSLGAKAAAGAGVSVASEVAVDTEALEAKNAGAAAAASSSGASEEGLLAALKDHATTQRAIAAKSFQISKAAKETADIAETAAGQAMDTAAVGNVALKQLDEVSQRLGQLRAVAESKESAASAHNHKRRRVQHEHQRAAASGGGDETSANDDAGGMVLDASASEPEDPAAIKRKSELLLASAAPWRNAWQGLASGQKARFTGRWKSKDGDFPVIGDDNMVTFKGGYKAKISYGAKNTVSIHMEDQVIDGKLSDGVLLWQDGDVWSRAQNEAKLFAGRWKSKEGDFPVISGETVTFQGGYKGKIKYLSSTKLIAKVDGVATKGKLADGRITWADGDVWERVPDEDKDIDVIFSGIVKMLSHVYKEAKDSLYGSRAKKPPPMAAIIAQASKDQGEDEALTEKPSQGISKAHAKEENVERSTGDSTSTATKAKKQAPEGVPQKLAQKQKGHFSPYNKTNTEAVPKLQHGQAGKDQERRDHASTSKARKDNH